MTVFDRMFDPMTTFKAILHTLGILALLTVFAWSAHDSLESNDLAQLLSIGVGLFLGRTIYQIWAMWDMDR